MTANAARIPTGLADRHIRPFGRNADRHRALGEIRRVLRPDGWLYAATNGRDNLRELRELCGKAAPPEDWRDYDSFGLESGAEQLAGVFDTVIVRRFADALEITEVEPLLAYLRSLTGLRVVNEGRSAP